MQPMDIAWLLLKRQTELGEYHEDFPSSHGPVTGYRAVSDKRREQITREGLEALPIESRGLPGLSPSKAVWAYMSHDDEGRKKAKEQAEYWASVMSEQRDRPSSVVGIRGKHDLSYEDYEMHDHEGNYPWDEDDWASYGPYAIPHDIPPEQIVRI